MRRFSTSMSRRAKLRLLAGGMAGVAVLAIAVLVVRNQHAYRLADLALLGLKSLPSAGQRIEDFHRVKVKNARKVWELSAREASYLEDRDEIVVIEPRVSFYVRGGDGGRERGVISLRGGEGRLALKGREVQRLSLGGGIHLRFRDFVVRTQEATFEQEGERVVAPGKVSITGDGVSLTGEEMVVDVASERAILNNVETILSSEGMARR